MLKWIERLEAPNRPWFLWAMLFLGILDYYVLVIPMDGLFVSYVLFFPGKWWRACLVMTLGAILGGGSVIFLSQKLGEEFIFEYFPNVMDTTMWRWAQNLLESYGHWMLFLFGLSPLAQLPAVLAAGLFHLTIVPALTFYAIGRLLKNIALSQITLRAPQKLSRLWGMKEEIKEVQALPLDGTSPLESQTKEISKTDHRP